MLSVITTFIFVVHYKFDIFKGGGEGGVENSLKLSQLIIMVNSDITHYLIACYLIHNHSLHMLCCTQNLTHN